MNIYLFPFSFCSFIQQTGTSTLNLVLSQIYSFKGYSGKIQ